MHCCRARYSGKCSGLTVGCCGVVPEYFEGLPNYMAPNSARNNWEHLEVTCLLGDQSRKYTPDHFIRPPKKYILIYRPHFARWRKSLRRGRRRRRPPGGFTACVTGTVRPAITPSYEMRILIFIQNIVLFIIRIITVYNKGFTFS